MREREIKPNYLSVAAKYRFRESQPGGRNQVTQRDVKIAGKQVTAMDAGTFLDQITEAGAADRPHILDRVDRVPSSTGKTMGKGSVTSRDDSSGNLLG